MSRSAKRRKTSEDVENDASEVSQAAHDTQAAVKLTWPDSNERKQCRTVFVRSLPATVNNDRLAEFFSQSYPLKHATVVLDPQTKAPKGYGFVTFADAEDAQAAVVELNNATLDGRKINVEIADPRQREIAEDSGRSRLSAKAIERKETRGKKNPETQAPRLIVRNLPWSIKDPDDLALLFRSYGKVKKAVIPKRGANEQAGFGFVLLRGRKNAEKAIAGVNGKVVDGRQLAVDWAVDKDTWESLQSSQNGIDLTQKPQASEIIDNNGVVSELGTQSDLPNQSAEAESEAHGHDAQSDDGNEVDNDQADLEGSASDISLEELEGDQETDSEEDQTEEAPSTTIFVRNLPFSSTDETLKAHFAQFGSVRYARIVMDPETERSKGTGFVCFFNEDDSRTCVKSAPKNTPIAPSGGDKKRRGESLVHSVLENVMTDPSGRYTIDGRVLLVSKALSKADAARKVEERPSRQALQERDKRRLYLLSEGTIAKGTKLYESLSQAEVNLREASSKQRQKQVKSNPSLHLSLTRLSVRNLPRHVSSSDLKALAREAVVQFATDVKQGVRQPLSREELRRAAEAMKEADSVRKQKGKGIVRQAKIVFEGREGTKVEEKSGAGRSRGYGFVEYVSHRSALMGLRWLNGHAIKANSGERSQRLIVEFAIENAQVVARRSARENPGRRPTSTGPRPRMSNERRPTQSKDKAANDNRSKRKRRDDGESGDKSNKEKVSGEQEVVTVEEKNKIAKRNRVIAKKRSMRKARKG